MFDKLIDWLIGFVDLFKFMTTIEPYERAVVTTLGKWIRILEPGPHLIWPLAIDNIMTDGVVTRTNSTGTQTLLSKDNISISLSVIVRWRISDIRKALLEVESVDHAFRDIAFGRVAETVIQHTWEEIRTPAFTATLLKACRKSGWRYGIEVEEVLFQDLTTTIPITLFNQT